MNRRAALLLTLLSGGWLTRRARTQDVDALDPAFQEPDEGPIDARPRRGGVSTTIPDEPGHEFRTFNLTPYTRLRHDVTAPQAAVIDWILRRTRNSSWFGERVTSLSADKTELRVYHEPRIIRQVAEIVDRFTNAVENYLSIRVRFIVATNPNWRYAVFNRLNPIAAGPQGQQVWTLDKEEAIQILTQFQIDQGFQIVGGKQLEIVNGQSTLVETTLKRTYAAGIQPETGGENAGQSPNPNTGNVRTLTEGVSLKISPLLRFEGDDIELHMDLRASSIKSFFRARVIGPRRGGAPEVNIEVPEVVSTWMETTIPRWPIDQALLISAGILPGILRNRSGVLNALGFANNNTELLVLLEARPVKDAVSRSR